MVGLGVRTRIGLAIALWGAGATSAVAQTSSSPSQYEMRTEKQQAKRIKAMSGLTVEAVAASVIVRDDPFETMIEMSSASVFPSPRSFTDRVLSDNYFRVFIERKTGAAMFQLYETLSYLDDRRHFDEVNVMMPRGLRTLALTRINETLGNCYAINLCHREEVVGFDLTEADMEVIAAMKPNSDGTPALLKFRFKSQTGFDWTDDIPAVEAEGVLVALKRWRDAKGL